MEAKKIIITGGATRIGAAIARSLAEYATDITIHYNSSASKAKKHTRKNNQITRYDEKTLFSRDPCTN